MSAAFTTEATVWRRLPDGPRAPDVLLVAQRT